MSLGGEAVMTIRMKKKYYSAKKIDWDHYEPSAEVIAGCEFEKELLELNKLCRSSTSTQKDIIRAKAAAQKVAQKKSDRNAPPCLTMIVKHGDIVVMHGNALQQIFEVCFDINRSNIVFADFL